MHFTHPTFWERYKRLPADIRLAADRAFELLKENPRHPSLRLKKAGRYWSARVGRTHRALAVEVEGGLAWFWIGAPEEYELILR